MLLQPKLIIINFPKEFLIIIIIPRKIVRLNILYLFNLFLTHRNYLSNSPFPELKRIIIILYLHIHFHAFLQESLINIRLGNLILKLSLLFVIEFILLPTPQRYFIGKCCLIYSVQRSFYWLGILNMRIYLSHVSLIETYIQIILTFLVVGTYLLETVFQLYI